MPTPLRSTSPFSDSGEDGGEDRGDSVGTVFLSCLDRRLRPNSATKHSPPLAVCPLSSDVVPHPDYSMAETNVCSEGTASDKIDGKVGGTTVFQHLQLEIRTQV